MDVSPRRELFEQLSTLVLICVGSIGLVLAGCGGGEEERKPAGPGQECDSSRDKPCEDGFVCQPDGEGTDRCQKPVGASCDPAADTNHCVAGTDCFDVPVEDGGADAGDAGSTGDTGTSETEGRCLVTEGGECNAEDPQCAPNLSCAEKQDGSHACFPPVYIEGDVRDSTNDEPIAGAHVIALDEVKVAVTDVAVSDEDGSYQLEYPVVRNDDGSPVDKSLTLRADAQDYQTFPSGLRQALPLNTSDATDEERGWVIDESPTDIILIPLPEDAQGNASISGSILADENSAGVLVVAEGNGSAFSAVSDRVGNYTIFNVPSGSYDVRGYAAGLQLTPAQAEMADEDLTDVDLETSGEALSTVSGSVNIVDAPGGSQTSVVLVVESTFDEEFVRGEVPPGLRAPESGPPDVESGFTIEDVPNGDYVVLAAFENDELVRDPDENIAGTGFVRISVPDGGSRDVTLPETFKVTEALDVITPGAERPEAVSSAPTLTWADDSSEEYYTLEVYNAYGDKVWPSDPDYQVPGVSGSDQVTVDYQGPMESGMYYQFRATSWRAPGGNAAPISTTEDLLGVFYVE